MARQSAIKNVFVMKLIVKSTQNELCFIAIFASNNSKNASLLSHMVYSSRVIPNFPNIEISVLIKVISVLILITFSIPYFLN